MRSYCLVLVDLALVGRDIAVTLEQSGLGVPVISTHEADALERLSQLEPTGTVHLAVIQADVDTFTQSKLGALLLQAGSKIILINDGLAQTTVGTFPLLKLPFFTEDLEQMLVQMFGPYNRGRCGGAS